MTIEPHVKVPSGPEPGEEADRLARLVVDACLKIHRELGPGLLELKSVERLSPVHKKQLLTYLRLMGLHLGLLVNFGEELMKTGIHRIINNRISGPGISE